MPYKADNKVPYTLNLHPKPWYPTYSGGALAQIQHLQVPGGFPKLGLPFKVLIILRTIVFWGLYWGPFRRTTPLLGLQDVLPFVWSFRVRAHGGLSLYASRTQPQSLGSVGALKSLLIYHKAF